MNKHGRPVAAGEPANLTVFDPSVEWEVVPAKLASKSHNTPYVGVALRGRVRHTFLFGEPTVLDGAATKMKPNKPSTIMNDYVIECMAMQYMMMQNGGGSV